MYVTTLVVEIERVADKLAKSSEKIEKEVREIRVDISFVSRVFLDISRAPVVSQSSLDIA